MRYRSSKLLLLLFGIVFIASCEGFFNRRDLWDEYQLALEIENNDHKKSLRLYRKIINQSEDDSFRHRVIMSKGMLLMREGMEIEGARCLHEAAKYYWFSYFVTNDGQDVYRFALCIYYLGYEHLVQENIDTWIERHPSNEYLPFLKKMPLLEGGE